MKTKFTWREWCRTGPDENLLTLNKEDAIMFKLIVSMQP